MCVLGSTAALFALAVLPGCGKAIEEATEAAIETNMPGGGNVEIDSDGGKITIETNDGQGGNMEIDSDTGGISIQSSDGQGGTVDLQAGDSVALPADFPEDIPVPDGVTWNVVQNSSAAGAAGVTAQGMLETPVAEVAAFMKKEAEAGGWTQEQAMQQGGMEMLVYKKGERMLHITATDTGDKTALVISSQ